MSTINLTPFGTNTSLITNADQGVLLSWQTNWTSTSQTYNVATTAATNVTSQTTTNYLVQPVLQAQDETFYGTFSTSSGTNMIKFGPSGNVQWSVPDTPQIATADGGVIGASGITYDSNGNASGETSLPTYSWTGAAYTDGPVNQIVAMYPNTATSFWAGGDANLPPGANASGTNTAYQSIEQTLYMRIFAPFYAFGPDPLANTGGYTPVVNPCLQYCFLGDNRSFTTKVDRGVVTSRINGFVTLRSPGVAPIDPKVYSDLTTAIYRTPPNNTGKSNSTIDMLGPRTGNHLQMHLRGADPLVPLAPNIDMNLFITSSVTNGQVCYSGNLIGDAFPDTEVFVVNSEGQATTLMTYATTDGPNSGPWTLWNPIPLSLGSFSNVCVPK
jgi:hypothetical protein